MILHWPGTIRPARYDDLVSTIDLAPTILSAAGLPIPNSMTGVDLLNKVRDGQPIDRDAVFGEIFLHTCVDIDRPGVNLTHRWIRAGQWKLIDPVEASTPSELYNIVQDPHEVHNQSTQQTAVREGLQARLDQWWSDTRGETTLSR
jgi:uncharacterized sulfatase